MKERMLNEEHTGRHCELADSNVSMVYQLTITVAVLGVLAADVYPGR